MFGFNRWSGNLIEILVTFFLVRVFFCCIFFVVMTRKNTLGQSRSLSRRLNLTFFMAFVCRIPSDLSPLHSKSTT